MEPGFRSESAPHEEGTEEYVLVFEGTMKLTVDGNKYLIHAGECICYNASKAHISCERARIWTESFKRTEGLPQQIRTAQAFYDACHELPVTIFEGELDDFATRPQDPYDMTDEQREFFRKEIFPYWAGKSVEDTFLARASEETKKIGVDTGFLDTDSKWRGGIGEISPDYVDQLFPKGFGGIKKEAMAYMEGLSETDPADMKKRDFYKSILLVCDGIIALANRYSQKAKEMAAVKADAVRKAELEEIAAVCAAVPENPPKSFREAIQFAWFVEPDGTA